MVLVGLSYLRSFFVLGLMLALAACAGQAPQPAPESNLPSMLGNGAPPPPPTQSTPGSIGRTSGNVALLLPLTGDLAPVGQALENAAKLALPDGGTPSLDVRDTGGTPAGAAAAAAAAIAAGDGIILGPLTAAETQAVAPVAQAAGVNMLAFTNDGTVAAPGVWTLGITPTQQVQRVLQAAADAGRTQLAALLPDDEFGHHLADALNAQTSALSEPAPQITFYEPGFSGIQQATDQMSDFADRGQAIEDQIKAAQDLDTPAGREKAQELQHQQIPPPNFNALFIGEDDTSNTTLDELANFLPYYDVNPPAVQFLGPARWADVTPNLGDIEGGVYRGALYAAPDPADATGFVAKYQAAYGAAPPDVANLGFDAAAIAKLASGSGGYTTTVLTAPDGFAGTDGVLVLQPTGQVLRGLAVFQAAAGAPVIASPAPTTLTTN